MPRAQESVTRTVPTWRYDAERGVLYVSGHSFRHDLEHVWELIETDQVPFLLEAIVHTVEHVGVPWVMCGHHLSEWLVDRTCPDWLWHFETQARKSA